MKDPDTDTEFIDCPTDDLVPFLTGELDRENHEKVRQHIERCELCRTDLEGFKRVVSALDRPTADAECRDTAGEIVSRARHTENIKAVCGSIAAAAVFILLTTLFTVFYASRDTTVVPSAQSHMDSSEARLEKACEWLVSAQSEDGGWHAESWEGQAPYTVGITSLAVIALLNREAGSEEITKTLEKAVDFLKTRSTPGGGFGDSTCIGMYNHSIATTALLEVYANGNHPELKQPLEQALGTIAEHIHGPDSFIGGRNMPGPLSSVGISLSVWQLNALGLGTHLGFEKCSQVYPKARNMFHEFVKGNQGNGRFVNIPAFPAICFYEEGPGCNALSSRVEHSLYRAAANRLAEKPDYYSWYALSCGLTSMDRETMNEFDSRIRGDILALQSSTGDSEGSWEPVDAWSSAGGRVYSTAMAVMALNAEKRFSRLEKILK